MRIDGYPFVCSTNCHIDKTMSFPLSPMNPSDFKSLLLSARNQYIDAIAPHITVSEQEFKKQMKELNVRKIFDSNSYHREKVYNLRRLDSATTAFHTWSAAWQLKGKRWSFPCAKCELCHGSYYTWQCHGQRCTQWFDSFDINNCGETVALAIALKEAMN